MSGTTWRLIDTGPMDGVSNMAIDEALLDTFDPEQSTPVLRLYGWNPPALSFGRFQDPGEVLDLERCRAARVTAVQRITGGGVIYHADELTYAIVCAPQHLPGETTVKESFRFLTGFLLTFYRELGLPAAYAADVAVAMERLGRRTSFCFAGRESYDILIEGRKIGGNAQRRLRKSVFQHGSIPLVDRVATGIGFLRERPSGPDLSVTDLAMLGVNIPEDTLKKRLAAAFAGAIGGTLVPSQMTAAERERAACLTSGKYASDTWNRDGMEA
jgi:lipoyl(octanoyl) transferase